MLYKTIFTVSSCALLLTIASCTAQEAAPASTGQAEVSKVETVPTVPITESNEVPDSSQASEVIIGLGDKKLTMQQVQWMEPGADSKKIAGIANWWLENELMCAEAERRGITEEPRAMFLADMMRKRVFSRELVSRVQEDIKISDEKILAYYEENKDADPRLKQPGALSFSHVRTKTSEEAQAVLNKIKAGEDINVLAKELSTYGDAKNGGALKKLSHMAVKRSFGNKFFEALMAAKENELIGPIEISEDSYEVVRLEGKTEPEPFPFEQAKGPIKSRLQRIEERNAFKTLLDALKEQAADKIVKSPLITQTEKPAENQ